MDFALVCCTGLVRGCFDMAPYAMVAAYRKHGCGLPFLLPLAFNRATQRAMTQPFKAEDLLEWYDVTARRLPQEGKVGVLPDPYHVWLSEIMLQQTTVAAVKSYYEKFIDIWPDVHELAASPLEDVMKAWAGLGYYSRARNLHACAQVVVAEYGGQFPQTAAELSNLPGIGAYTSAAIAAIAFQQPIAVVDGNIERVFTRLVAIETPLPAAKEQVRTTKQAVLPKSRPGDFAQGLMDLGATICTPKRPACALCPVKQACLAYEKYDPEHFPVKAPKKAKPNRRGAAFVYRDGAGRILLEKRGDTGLLAKMTQVPTTPWSASKDGETDVSAAPFGAGQGGWLSHGIARHVFTHFQLELEIYSTCARDLILDDGQWWCDEDALGDEALPTVMKKAIETAIPGAFKGKTT